MARARSASPARFWSAGTTPTSFSVPSVRVPRLDLDQPQASVGERAGLVDADRVDGGERLGRRHLLDERVLARQPHRCDRERDAEQQHQALGDQGDEPGGRLLGGVAERFVVKGEAHEHDQGDRDERQRGRLQHGVDLDLQRRGGVAELPRLAGDLGRVAVLADRVDFIVARARDPERAREHSVAGPFADPVRLAGEQRLVHREAARVDHRAVGDQLIAGLDPDDVAGDDLVRGQLDDAAVADRLGARRDQQRELVERLLGLQLLADPDRRVDDRDQAEEGVGEEPERQHQDEEHRDDPVEQGEDVRSDDARD